MCWKQSYQSNHVSTVLSHLNRVDACASSSNRQQLANNRQQLITIGLPLATKPACCNRDGLHRICMYSQIHENMSKAARRWLCTFPEGEAALHPRCHASDQGHLAATAQHHGLPLFQPHIIHIRAVAAVILKHGLWSSGGVSRCSQLDDAVQTAHTRVRHLDKAHLGQVISTPVSTAQT